MLERSVERSHRGSIMIGAFEASRALAANDAQRAVRNIGNDAGVYDATTLVHTVRFRRWQSTGERAALRRSMPGSAPATSSIACCSGDARRIAGFHCDAPLLLAVPMVVEQERYERGVARCGSHAARRGADREPHRARAPPIAARPH